MLIQSDFCHLLHMERLEREARVRAVRAHGCAEQFPAQGLCPRDDKANYVFHAKSERMGSSAWELVETRWLHN